MSDKQEIPWNRKPKNGVSAFFTEASFCKWLQKESHESRLAANLEKFCKGVVLPKSTCTDNQISKSSCILAQTSAGFQDHGLNDPRSHGHVQDNPHNSRHRKEKEHLCGVSGNDAEIKDQPRALHVQTEQSVWSDGRTKIQTECTETKEESSDAVTMDTDRRDTSKLPPGPKLSPTKDTELNDAEKRKKAMENNLLFFNDKDRKDKYVPMLMKKRPKAPKSCMTTEEQRSYLVLKHQFRGLDTTQLNPKQLADYGTFMMLSEKVVKEQERFMKHLRYAFSKCEEDYRYLHREAEKYINEKFVMKRYRVIQYPRFYEQVGRINMIKEIDTKVHLQYVKPMLQLGTVPRIVLPQIVPGLPQPCTPTDCQKVSALCPTSRDVVKGVCVWDHDECSEDINAEQLAVPNKCDVVLSSSAIKHLIDNQGTHIKLWNIPVTVREYNIQEGDKLVTHRVIYLDKPMIKHTQYNFQDKNKLYQKYALKSVAMRLKQKSHTFSGLKPSCEVDKYVKIEQVQTEIDEYNEIVKKDMKSRKAHDDDTDHDDDVDRTPVGKKKYGKYWKKTPVDIEVAKNEGMFDLENDIDDLETFGRETSWKTSVKSSELLSPNKKLGDVSGSAAKRGKKGGKDVMADLEMFKLELEGLKAKQKKDSVKSLETVNTNNEKPSETMKTPVLTERRQSSEFKQMSNKKGGTSLSERLKQMSSIRSKLNMKPLHSELQTVDMLKSSTGAKDTVDAVGDGSLDNHTESDSEDSEDGLIIDMPTLQSTIHSDITKLGVTSGAQSPPTLQCCNETVSEGSKSGTEAPPTLQICADDMDEGPASPVPESPDSPTKSFEGAFLPSTCLQIPLDEDSNDGVLRDYSNVKYEKENEVITGFNIESSLVNKDVKTEDNKSEILKGDADKDKRGIDMEDIAETPEHDEKKWGHHAAADTGVTGIATRGSKRRSVEIHKEETLPKRRSLRSTRSNDLELGGPTVRNTRLSARCATSETSPDELGRKPREQKRMMTSPSDRLTRSQSASSEFSADETSPNIRVTRKILDRETYKTNENESKQLGKGLNSVESSENDNNIKDQNKNMGDETADHNKDLEKSPVQPKRRGRPATKKHTIAKQVENEKIKEMSEAMKRKIDTHQKADKSPDGGGVTDKGNEDEPKVKKKAQVTNVTRQDRNKTKEEGNTKGGTKGQSLGFDNILDLQTQLWKPPESKGAGGGSFAAQHGMSKVMFPLNHNITYHQWKLGDLNLLIRCSYDGYVNPQGFVHIATKMEYQPYFGFEKQTVNEIAKNWISTYIRPNCTLVRARINPYNSEVMMMDTVGFNDLIPPDSEFRPDKAMSDLQCTLKGLQDLPPGQYLLNNHPKRDHVDVLKAAEDGQMGPFDLHYYHASHKVYKEGERESTRARWIPVDTELFLQHQKKMNLIPCTFNPSNVQARHVQEKKTGKKKKKRRNKKKKTD